MTIFSPEGQPLGEDDVQWMADAILHWMEEDRTRIVVLQQRVYTPYELLELRQNLQRARSNGRLVRPDQLRGHMLRLLQNRVVRIRLAADVLKREAENRAGYEIMVDNFERAKSAWAKAKLLGFGPDPGPEPELPDALPDARGRHEVMKELQELREKLEGESGGTVVSPHGV